MILRVEAVSIAAGQRVLCSDLDFVIEPGELWAVLGCNGSGKSTLLHALAGLVTAPSGIIELAGKAVAGYSRRELGRTLGILLQREDAEYWGTVEGYVMLGRYPHTSAWRGATTADDAAVAEALAAFELEALASRSYETLSGGERQRARLAQLWAQNPSLLLLDEPLQHLDLRHQLRTVGLVRNAARLPGRAALIVLHDLTFAARCDKALLLYGSGSYDAGDARELLEPGRLEQLYGCRIRAFGSGADAHFMPVI